MQERVQRSSPDGLRVVVTGATSGVGEATAKLFAARGARVALLARRAEELQRVVADIGDAARGYMVDVAEADGVSLAVESAIEWLGGLDIAVNAAGVAGYVPLEKLDEHRWGQVVGTNLSGTFFVSRAVGLHLRAAGGGSIVNIASDLASMGAAGLVHYCAAKAGVVGLTRALAVELAPLVRVNAVCPGPIDTPMLRAGLAGTDLTRALHAKASTVPLARLASPAEVAAAVYFLAVEARFATGTCMALDGGTTAA